MTPLFGEPSIEKLAAKGDVKGLVKQLWHKNVTRQEMAMVALGRFNDPAIVDAILLKIKETWETYGQDEWKYRKISEYIGHLEEYFSDLILADLVEIYHSVGTFFCDAGHSLRSKIEDYVGKNGRSAFEPLSRMLKQARDGGYEEAHQCAHYNDTLTLLVRTADDRVAAALIEHLEIKINTRIKSHVITLLGRIGAKEALSHLVGCLAEEDEEVLAAAISGLERVGDASATPNLASILREHPKPDLRTAAAHTLGFLNDSNAVPHLIAALQDVDEDVVQSAVSALRRLGDRRSLQPLCEALAGERLPHYAARDAIDAIGEMADGSIAPTLIAISTSHPVPYVRSASLTILEDRLDAQTFNQLLAQSEDKEHELRLAAIAEDLDSYAEQLCGLYRAHPEGFARNGVGTTEKRIREIGANIAAYGGFRLMVEIHQTFSRICQVQGAARNLEHMWHGIDEWLG